ncbi:tetratricopeptide repeat protein [Scopulibacillus cellulosilyticus]|uniref:Tetratricopeptide repeat protein n=1 Tax=Scopulibacillus cellulosilyticus TaxID=2665665 RepID=A0ABW2PXK8_9BACL
MSKKAHIISFRPDGEYYFQKGISAYQKGDLYRAHKYVGRAIAFEPNETEYLCQQAAILAELEEYESSIDILNKVVHDLDEQLTECYFFMANNYAYLGRFDEALKEVRTYLSLDPKGSFKQEAMELYKLLTIESGHLIEEEESYIGDHEKGRQALERGQFDKAIGYFKKVIEDQPLFWAAYNNLAIAYFSQGHTDKAFETLHRILKKDIGNVHALCNLATFYYQINEKKQLDQLVPVLDKLHPFYPEHRSKLGSTYFFLGDYEKAYHWLISAEKAGVYGDQAFYYWLALSSYRIGRKDQAMRAWKKVDFFKGRPFHPYEHGKIQDMLLAGDAGNNPMVFSLVDQQLQDGETASKVFSLFYLNYLGNDSAKKRIEQFGSNMNGEQPFSDIACLLIEDQGDDKRIEIMRTLEKEFGNGAPIIDCYDLYGWWTIVFDIVREEKDLDVPGWAAALAYLWFKETGQKETQKNVAKRFGTTVYRLKKHIDQLGSILNDYEF